MATKVNEKQEKIFIPATPPSSTSLNRRQIRAYKSLIQDNPLSEQWQDKIKEIQKAYPARLGGIKPLTSEQINALSEEEYEARVNRISQYNAIENPDVKPVSITSGMKIITANPCKSNFFDDVETELDNFLKLATRVDNFALDLPGEIKNVAKLINTSSKEFVTKIGNALSDSMIGWVKDGLDGVATKIFSSFSKFNIALPKVINAQSALINPITKLFGSLDCLSAKVSGSLQGAIEDMLTGMVKNVLNGAACAAQQFMGALTQKITGMIDKFVSPFTSPLSKIFGGGGLFGKVSGVKNFIGNVKNGFSLLGKLRDPFGCKPPKPKCKPDAITVDKGTGETKSGAEQQGILDKVFEGANNAMTGLENTKKGIVSGITSSISNFEEEYGQWEIFGTKVGEATDHGLGTDCYTGNIFKCGFPKVKFFGGDGVGAAGKVLLGNFIDRIDYNDIFADVKSTAGILGVEVTDPGEGYTEEPLVEFTDSCDQGYGAFGKVIIDKNVNSPTYGQVVDVVITSEGENYPIGETNDQSQLYISKILIENPGKGYENASIEDECLTLNVEDGRCVSVTITCQKPYSTTPRIVIKNPGTGAVLRPIMSLTKNETQESPVLQTVVDCVGDFPIAGED